MYISVLFVLFSSQKCKHTDQKEVGSLPCSQPGHADVLGLERRRPCPRGAACGRPGGSSPQAEVKPRSQDLQGGAAPLRAPIALLRTEAVRTSLTTVFTFHV